MRDVFTTPEVLASRVATGVGRYLIADPRKSGSATVDAFARKSIADGATAAFVDVMRLACVSGSPAARRVNEPRYIEFIDIADQHLSEFRGQIGRLSSERNGDFPHRCAELETNLGWAVMRLRRSAVRGAPWGEFVRVLRQLADRVDAPADAAASEYYRTRAAEVSAVAIEEKSRLVLGSLKDPDSFVYRRFAMQSAVLSHMKQTAAVAISTVRDDIDRLLAIPYFAIDLFLPHAITDGK